MEVGDPLKQSSHNPQTEQHSPMQLVLRRLWIVTVLVRQHMYIYTE